MHSLPIANWPSRLALATLATSAVLLSGCSSMTSSFSSTTPLVSNAAAVTGHVHGGNQAVANAAVSLYIAGVNGQSATAATYAATTTTTTDGTGSFSFVKDSNYVNGTSNLHADNHFACPPGATDPYVFVVARGGSTVNGTSSGSNPDAAFIAPMGSCSAINAGTFINMSEVVTVATMAAIHQFMNPTLSSAGNSTTPIEQSVSSDGIFVASAALTNSFNSVANIVDLSTGLARTSLTTSGATNGSAGVQVTITPETAKINQLANIISSCINFAPSPSTPTNPTCANIYSNATPPSPSVTSMPGATMNAAQDLLTALYYIFTNTNLGSTQVGNLNSYAGTGPYTPTLSSAPTDWSIGVQYTSTSTCSNGGGSFFASPGSLSVDIYGDLWVGNNSNASTPTLAQLAHNGLPTSCTTLTPVTSAGSSVNRASTTVDIQKNIYSGSLTSSDIYRFTPSSSPSTPIDIPTPAPPTALASDSNGNLFYTASDGNLYEIPSAATTSSFNLASSTRISGSTFPAGNNLAIDAAGRIWTGTVGRTYLIYFLPPTQSITHYQETQQNNVSFSSVLAVGRSTGVTPLYITDPSTSAITLISLNDSTNALTQNSSFSSSSAGLTSPGSLVIDGAGNIWAANTTTASIAAIDVNGNALTPSTGVQKAATPVGNNASAIAVDASGNLWIPSGPNSITQIVGEAVPVVVPYSSALAANRFQSIP